MYIICMYIIMYIHTQCTYVYIHIHTHTHTYTYILHTCTYHIYTCSHAANDYYIFLMLGTAMVSVMAAT